MADATLGQMRIYFSLDTSDEEKLPFSEIKDLGKNDRDELKTLLGELFEVNPDILARVDAEIVRQNNSRPTAV